MLPSPTLCFRDGPSHTGSLLLLLSIHSFWSSLMSSARPGVEIYKCIDTYGVSFALSCPFLPYDASCWSISLVEPLDILFTAGWARIKNGGFAVEYVTYHIPFFEDYKLLWSLSD